MYDDSSSDDEVQEHQRQQRKNRNYADNNNNMTKSSRRFDPELDDDDDDDDDSSDYRATNQNIEDEDEDFQIEVKDWRDKWIKVNKIGEGASGSVILAKTDPSLNLPPEKEEFRAIKIVPVPVRKSERKKIFDEIKLLSISRCDYIYYLHDYGMFQQHFWFELEFFDGGSLAKILSATAVPIPFDSLLVVVHPILNALIYLHKLGYIHRDVKADNILVSTKSSPKLGDLGIATPPDQVGLNPQESIMGTPYWMAPEMVQEEIYDYKVDVWALGITCIELLDLKPPLFDESPMRALFQIGEGYTPKLENSSKYPKNFLNYLSLSFKSVAERPSSEEIIKHEYFQKFNPNESKQVFSEYLNTQLIKIEAMRKEKKALKEERQVRQEKQYDIEKIKKAQRVIRKYLIQQRFRRLVAQACSASSSLFLRTRSEILKEIISSEKVYLSNLTSAYKELLHPLQSQIGVKLKQSGRDRSPLVNSYKAIRTFTQELYTNLDQRYSQWPTQQLFTDIFIDLFPKMQDAYQQYLNIMSSGDDPLLSQFESDISLQQIERELTKRMKKGHTLKEYLNMPTTRPVAYEHLLNNLLKFTPEEHVDFSNVQSSIKLISEFNHSSIVENRCRIQQLQSVSSMIAFLPFKLWEAPDRKYLREGRIKTKYCKDLVRHRFFWFLFTDIMIQAKKRLLTGSSSTSISRESHKEKRDASPQRSPRTGSSSPLLRFVATIYLDRTMITEDGRDTMLLQDTSTGNSWTLFFQSPEEKDSWKKDIQELSSHQRISLIDTA